MPNEELLAYVRMVLEEGASREDLTRSLLAAGWQVGDVNAALDAAGSKPSSVSDRSSHSAARAREFPVPTPGQTEPPVEAVELSPTATSADVVLEPQEPAPAPAPSTGSGTAALPSSSALIGKGLARYRKCFKTIAFIALLQVLYGLAIPLLQLALTPVIRGADSSAITIGYFAGAAVLFLISIWFYAVTGLAMADAIRGCDEGTGFRQAMGDGLKRAVSYFWFGLLCTFIVLGYLFIVLLLVGVIAGAVAVIVAGFSSSLIPVASSLFGPFLIAALVAVGIRVGPWLSLAIWVFVEREASGLFAIASGREMVRARSGSIAWRWFLIAFASVFFTLLVALAVGLFVGFSAAPGALGPWFALAGQTVMNVVVYAVIAPIALAAYYALYEAVRASEPVQEKRAKRLGFAVLAVLGALGLLALAVGSVSALSSLGSARSAGGDASIESYLNTVQVGAEIYFASNGDSYGTTQSCTQGVFADSVVARAISGMASEGVIPTCRADGSDYAAYAPLSSGQFWCVDSARDAVAVPSAPSGFTCFGNSTSSPDVIGATTSAP